MKLDIDWGGRNPWERLPRETAVAYEAFSTYRDLGPARSLSKAARGLGKAKRTMEDWSSRHHWVARVNAWDAYYDEHKLDFIRKEHEEMLVWQASKARKMQELGFQGLDIVDLAEASLAEITRLIKEGMLLERSAKQIPESVEEIKVTGLAEFARRRREQKAAAEKAERDGA